MESHKVLLFCYMKMLLVLKCGNRLNLCPFKIGQHIVGLAPNDFSSSVPVFFLSFLLDSTSC